MMTLFPILGRDCEYCVIVYISLCMARSVTSIACLWDGAHLLMHGSFCDKYCMLWIVHGMLSCPELLW
jgi:hypothetical protein